MRQQLQLAPIIVANKSILLLSLDSSNLKFKFKKIYLGDPGLLFRVVIQTPLGRARNRFIYKRVEYSFGASHTCGTGHLNGAISHPCNNRNTIISWRTAQKNRTKQNVQYPQLQQLFELLYSAIKYTLTRKPRFNKKAGPIINPIFVYHCSSPHMDHFSNNNSGPTLMKSLPHQNYASANQSNGQGYREPREVLVGGGVGGEGGTDGILRQNGVSMDCWNQSNGQVMPQGNLSHSDAVTVSASINGGVNVGYLPSGRQLEFEKRILQSSHLETLDLPLASLKNSQAQGAQLGLNIGIQQQQIAATSASTLSSNPNRQKFSDLGMSLINDKNQSQVHLATVGSATNHQQSATGVNLGRQADLSQQDSNITLGNKHTSTSANKYPGRPSGIPRLSQGNKILKFQGMRMMNGSCKNNENHYRSNDRLSNAGMQVMAIQQQHLDQRGETIRARQSSAVLNTLNGGSSSHLENKKEVKDFITKIPGIKASIRLQKNNRQFGNQNSGQDLEQRFKDAPQTLQKSVRNSVDGLSQPQLQNINRVSTHKQANKKQASAIQYDYNHDFRTRPVINSRQELKRGRHSGSINLSPAKKNTISGQELSRQQLGQALDTNSRADCDLKQLSQLSQCRTGVTLNGILQNSRQETCTNAGISGPSDIALKAVSRKYSGSKSRIPIYKGGGSSPRSDDENRSLNGGGDNRSSSLSNYQGKIPRLKSNERLALMHELQQEQENNTAQVAQNSRSLKENSKGGPNLMRVSLAGSTRVSTIAINNRASRLDKQSGSATGPKQMMGASHQTKVGEVDLQNNQGKSHQQLKKQKSISKQLTNNIKKPRAQTIRQLPDRTKQNDNKNAQPYNDYEGSAPVQVGFASRHVSARPKMMGEHGGGHVPANLDNHLRKLELKKFGDDQLGELAYLQLQEAKKRLRHFVINTDMVSDQKEKHRLLSYFRHRSHTYISILKECLKARKCVNSSSSKQKDLSSHYGPSVVQPPSIEQQKIFQLTNKKQSQCENLPQEKVDSRAREAIEQFRRDNNVDATKKIFIVLGQYQDMRDAMKRHGWVENPIDSFESANDYRVHAFHFCYTTKSRDAFKYQTASFQQINHFEGTKALTTKVGLTHNMKNLVWQHDTDINEVFPQSYDLTDANSEEFKDFMAEMKFGQLVACLKAAMGMSQSNLQKNMDRIVISIGYVDRRIKLMSEELLSPNQTIVVPGQNNELDFITDDIYYFIQGKSGGHQDFSKMPLFIKLQKQNQSLREITPKNAKERIGALLGELKKAMGSYQYALYGTKNAWIVKPGGKSRGRGIQIHTTKDNLNNYIRSSMDKIWVTQKYIEAPLIIKQKKFDIRQWVCVTSWKPKLEIWFYTDNYLRFTSDNYDPNQLNNKFANLTNATINKENVKMDSTTDDSNFSAKLDITDPHEIEQLRIHGNMWTNQQFELFLHKLQKSQGTQDTQNLYPNGIYQDRVLPLLKQGVIASILATRNSVVQNAPYLTHEIFGYDFMVDTSYNVWLIEVNSSPSMEYSSAITERYVKEGLANLADIAMEQEKSLNGAPWNHTVGSKIGKFELIFQE